MSKARLARVVEAIAAADLAYLLVTGLLNLRYLTGFTGTSGLALIGADERHFVTDFRYVEQAAEQVGDGWQHHVASEELLDVVPGLVDRGRDCRLGFDDAQVSVKTHARLRELLGEDGPELVRAGGLLEAERAVKDAGERERIAAAAALGDEAFAAILEQGLVGCSERQLAWALEDELRKRGAQPAFDTIVAAGAHGALPHAEPRDVEIPPQTLVIIDWGALLDGYCSDCTRTLATGRVDSEQQEVYELVRAAQQAASDAIAAGRGGRELDGVARERIEGAGHGEHFGHGLGHGVGLEIHEAPRLSKRSEDTLVAGNVVTVEPGVYLPGRFGVRIEDLVVVTTNGSDVLSQTPKDLTTVG
ncbi:MAG TPA: Xaa-Pro peptidase family protein [Solirubrobacteraceae bacterium]|nr:Xaa-Pro peptidase family protein [Solirubrobacteraceae bacterium]